MSDLLKRLCDKSNQIHFIELAGLLHDIGKLSKVFLEYRQKWQDYVDYPDPHVDKFFDTITYEPFPNQVPEDFKAELLRILNFNEFEETDFSIKKAVDAHVRRDSIGITKLLKAADGLDSAIDRNNPLWGAEQKDKIFRSNVFGYEGNKIVTVESQEKARQELYRFLGDKLPDYFKHFDNEARIKILKGIKRAFDQGLADTTRPQNDTTLWEHSYAVASILKVITVHYIFRNEKLDDIKKVKFGIFGIGWDGMRFLSYGQKIGDIVGRKRIIEDVKGNLKVLIEYEYPIGNEIYSDGDGIYFIVPAGLDDDRLKELRNKIVGEVYKITAETSARELQPHIVDISETKTLTSLVRAIREMKEKVSYPFDSSVNEFDEYFKITLETFEQGKTVCPICRFRPVEKEDEKKKVCKTCKGRRKPDDKNRVDECRPKNNETLFIDEIVDKHRKAALIVARFGLDDWLKGTMVRSLFVTEANGIEREVKNLGNVKQFEVEERKIKEFLENKNYGKFDYNRIKADIDALFKNEDEERAKHIAFLYDRRSTFNPDMGALKEIRENWEGFLDSAKKENPKIDIYNLINAKTPTPSTLLDVWNTTLMFFEDKSKNIAKDFLPENKRLKLKVRSETNQNLKDWGKGTLEAESSQTAADKIELLYMDKNTIEIIGEIFSDSSVLKWKGEKVKITDNDYKGSKNAVFKIEECLAGDSYVPFRTITATPNLFMAIVPADRVVEITDIIYRNYIEHFGKVMGRLPFSIGNIFFGRKMPMFVVLDAGKRMVNNFDRLSKEGKHFTVLKDKEDIASDTRFNLKCTIGKLDKTLTWRLPFRLGNCKDDFHHAYLTVNNNKENPPDDRKTFFKTIAGDVVHFSDIKAGDQITVFPNYYDFEFLDSNTRRYDINLGADKRRKSNVADFKSKPFLLDELGQKIMCLWSELLQGQQLKGITDTKLRNLQSLWLTKYQEWDAADNSKGHKTWKDFVTCSIRKEFKKIDDEHCALLMETINNGLFFDTLELYLGILKERIDTK